MSVLQGRCVGVPQALQLLQGCACAVGVQGTCC